MPAQPATPAATSRGQRTSVVLGSLFIAAYLGCNLYYLAKNAIGDMGSHPLAYFFTWDMFPGYSSVSIRRFAVGQTARGDYVQLYPSARQRFRRGTQRTVLFPETTQGADPGAYARADIDRSGLRFKQLVDHELRLSAAGLKHDPVVKVWLLEHFWAKRLNLPPDLYHTWSGEPKPEAGRYWRIVEEYDPRHAG